MPVTLEQADRRVYLVGLPYPDKDLAKSRLGLTGANWDPDRKQWWVGLAKLEAARALAAELNARTGPAAGPNPAAVRVYAKVRYKGRTYYLAARGQTRVRLVSLPQADGTFLDFWADRAEVAVEKEYQPRRVGYGRYAREEHQTLAGLAAFVARNQAARAAGAPTCPACGRAGELVEDLEDGLHKCRGCCDMPAA